MVEIILMRIPLGLSVLRMVVHSATTTATSCMNKILDHLGSGWILDMLKSKETDVHSASTLSCHFAD